MRGPVIKYIKFALIIIVVPLICFYAYLQSYEFLAGPSIIIYSPDNGSTVNNNYLEIIGNAKNVASISLNDREISTDMDGGFKEELLLSPGYNIITLKARDRFDRNRLTKLELVYAPIASTSSTATSSDNL